MTKSRRCPHGVPMTREFACPTCVKAISGGLGAVERRYKPPVRATPVGKLTSHKYDEHGAITLPRGFCPTDDYRHLLGDETRRLLELREEEGEGE